MNLLHELQRRIAAALAPLTDDVAIYATMVRPAQDARFGDYQANCAMPLAGALQQKPREVAERIVASLDVADLCHPPEIAGPGFINLRLRDDWLRDRAAELLADERLGVPRDAHARHYVIDFSSPNVAKPMHVGHLRSTVIGDALCRILRFLGHRVTSDNHIGDWGTQFGMIIYGYKHFLDAEAFAAAPVPELSRLYRLVNQLSDYRSAQAELPAQQQRLAERLTELAQRKAALDPQDKAGKKELGKLESSLTALRDELAAAERKIAAVESDSRLKSLAEAHPEIARAARSETAKLHAGDAENTRLWNQFLPACLDMLHAMYARLGIAFDLELGESYYQPMLSGVVEDLERKGLAVESDGARCVFIAGNAAPFIVRKQDGAFTYATTDLATIRHRVDVLAADEILYVVDSRQSEHFKLLFEAARLWGYDATAFRHISFGSVLGEDRRPLKTRAGDNIGLESLIDEAIAEARKIVDASDDEKANGRELDDAARQRVAEAVGIGGLKYADLSHNRDSDYVFSWEKMLAKEGDTATYVQYAHARICGIIRKGAVDRTALRAASRPIVLSEPEERALLLQLVRFAEAVSEVRHDYRPNLLTQTLFETANLFSGFYVKCPVLKADDIATRDSRLALCDLTARVLSTGLALLGIDSPEQM